ncbi:CGNR zinc finger domain-containing protein [Phaeacidiphilus oryzae]|uniref:CGNR zinc finger domain-containing protein n=1 Tax=Phaeacidiphilus oryzae TaxID=348818 RepID=UPI000690BC71|nr:CGNR zinc finger domain-containing protein [Phaeacidiphilus oryzae]
MDLTSYADLAVRLVNTEQPERGTDALTTVEAIRALFPAGSRGERLADESDLPRLRAVRTRLRAVFTSAAEGDQPRAVALLNELLAQYPVSAEITAHSGEGWHLHLAESNTPTATAICAGTASAGLAAHLTRHGAERLGVCAAAPCRNAYLDTSTNRSRRYCSDRCATRHNVAAHRARRRG